MEETERRGCLFGLLVSQELPVKRSEVTGLSLCFKSLHFQEQPEEFVYMADLTKDV